MSPVTAILGDSREKLAELEANSLDACVTDPPYALVSIVKRFGADGAAPAKSNGATGVYARASAGFMGQKWDTGETAFDPAFWAEVLRVLKPGAHLLAFGGTRTYHRLACAIEDAGFEIRDTVMWHYGSGFPKSLDVSKAIDKARDDTSDVEAVRAWLEAKRRAAGVSRKEINAAMGLASNGGGLASTWTTNQTTRAVPQWDQWRILKNLLGLGDEMDAEVWRLNGRKGTPGEAWQSADVIETRQAVDIRNGHGREYGSALFAGEDTGKITLEKKAANSDAAKQWEGWGTALKPSTEIICLARKPLSESTVAANVLRWGTGALNIDGCRVPVPEGDRSDYGVSGDEGKPSANAVCYGERERVAYERPAAGRWPANLLHDGSEEVVAGFPETSSGAFTRSETARAEAGKHDIYGRFNGKPDGTHFPASEGSAARFFACFPQDPVLAQSHGSANAASECAPGSASCRPNSEFDSRDGGQSLRFWYGSKADSDDRLGSKHPTVKPVDLIAYLCRLVCPKGGLVLDCFAGSGTTGEACIREGMRAILIEREPAYYEDIQRRISLALAGPEERARAIIKAKGLVEPVEGLPLFSEAAE